MHVGKNGLIQTQNVQTRAGLGLSSRLHRARLLFSCPYVPHALCMSMSKELPDLEGVQQMTQQPAQQPASGSSAPSPPVIRRRRPFFFVASDPAGANERIERWTIVLGGGLDVLVGCDASAPVGTNEGNPTSESIISHDPIYQRTTQRTYS